MEQFPSSKNLPLRIVALLTFLLLTSPLLAQESHPFWSCCGSPGSSLEEWTQKLKHYPTYPYPYRDLASKLKKEGHDSLTIFAYGSLLDEASAKRTLSATSLKTNQLALALGAIRLFDRDVPLTPKSKWGQPASIKARGMLNLLVTHNPYDLVNGMTITLPLEELAPLAEREIGYDLVPLICAQWQESATATQEVQFCIAYALSAPQKNSYISSQILPRPGYYECTRDAAKQFGLLYYYLWMNTTYMADGKTPITTWERAVQEGKNDTLIFYK